MSRDQNAEPSQNAMIWKFGRIQIFGNNLNRSKFYSGEI